MRKFHSLLDLSVKGAALMVGASFVLAGFSFLPSPWSLAYQIGVTTLVVMWAIRRFGTAYASAEPVTYHATLLVTSMIAAALFCGMAQEEVFRQNPFEMFDQAHKSVPNTIALGLGGLIMAPILEETICRGFLLTRLKAEFSPATAIIVSSAIFAGMHLQAGALPQIFLGGVGLALIMHYTGRIWLCMIAHAGYNAVSGIGEAIHPNNGVWTHGYLYLGACCALSLACAAMFYRVLTTSDWMRSPNPHHDLKLSAITAAGIEVS